MNFLKKLFGFKNNSTSQNSNIVAAKVTKIEKHPNADRLQIVGVFDGQTEIYPIVCGAFNFKEGDIVALAKPGAQIAHNIHSSEHEPFTLDKATIRGVESQGMLCAAFELGKSTEIGEGIMILNPETKLGGSVV